MQISPSNLIMFPSFSLPLRESIAHNSTLPMNPALKLFPLVTPNGVVSEKFPVTLGQLFDMTGTPALYLTTAS